MKTKWQNPGDREKRAFQHERKKQAWVFSSDKKCRRTNDAVAGTETPYRGWQQKQNENQSQFHFREDCKAQVKKLPLFCKTVAPASAVVSLRICQPVAWPIPS
ncbi:hypothetical protein JAO85_24835 [Comamonas sp. NyZ500]|uniref:hypothetical protein n=1 Tax=Comamonas sp. NyZ500 TaxID=2795732 RepID=UPI00192B259E|nr:hypothetical protein [Comamonas sp. NyZ500]MBL5980492.1 hypothetical protein [Comamonas sp. NyZ500]